MLRTSNKSQGSSVFACSLLYFHRPYQALRIKYSICVLPSLWCLTTGLLAWKPVNRQCTWWERSHSICSWKGTHLWWAIWCIVTQPRISCLHSEVVNDHFKTLRCSQWREAVEEIISTCFLLTQNAWNSLKSSSRYVHILETSCSFNG